MNAPTPAFNVATNNAMEKSVESARVFQESKVPLSFSTGALTPANVLDVMMQCASGDWGTGNVTVSAGLFAAAVTLVLDVPLDELAAIRAEYGPLWKAWHETAIQRGGEYGVA